LARDRSRPERTSEERARDRAERERRRGGEHPSEAPGSPPQPAPDGGSHAAGGEGVDPLVVLPSYRSVIPSAEPQQPAQDQAVMPSAPESAPPAPDAVPGTPPGPASASAAPPAPSTAPLPGAPEREFSPNLLAAQPPVAPVPADAARIGRVTRRRARASARSPRVPGPPSATQESRGRRAPLARLAAVVALAAVVVAVVLVVHSLDGTTTGTPVAAPPPEVRVLIPEGETRAQIAEIALRDGLKGDYRTASRSSAVLSPTSYGAPHGTPDLEGFLFPATYDMDKGATVSRLVEEQLVAFREHFGSEEVAAAHALGETPYQLLTVASMVEREAQIPSDRAKIAAVIYNRLKAGMPLGIDATIYYAVELARNIPTYTHELTEADLHIDSPYNTRTHLGLPPTPISNPGAASIAAAAHPAHVSYLYYVAGADGCGEQVFSNTEAEFETNVAAYQAALRRNGGHPPQCKHS
jgi:cell division protein YceG involved in septum cleavage